VIGRRRNECRPASKRSTNAGVTENIRLLVILNDNDMSISPPVGGLNRYLARLMSGKFHAAAKNVGKADAAPGAVPVRACAQVRGACKGMVVPGTLFEEFGFNYIGPIDGHDLDSLIPTLQNLRELTGPQFLHVVTKKGAGLQAGRSRSGAVSRTRQVRSEGGIKKAAAGKPTYTQVFGDWLCDMARDDPRLVGITPAMREGSGMVRFEREFPNRYFDVGIGRAGRRRRRGRAALPDTSARCTAKPSSRCQRR